MPQGCIGTQPRDRLLLACKCRIWYQRIHVYSSGSLMATVRSIRRLVKISGPESSNHILVQTVQVAFLFVTDRSRISIN